MIDLHIHSTASDGQYTPSDLITLAATSGISVVALTDHDTTSGVEEAKKVAEKQNITFIKGVELSIDWPTGEFHLLGLGLQENSSELTRIMATLRQNRQKRNYQIVQKMKDSGIQADLKEIEEYYQTENLGRPHLADFLIRKGVVRNRQIAFDKYLAKGRPFYVSRESANLDECINAINESGGVPVIAHPLSLYVSWGKIEPVLTQIFERGVMGLEAYHPGVRVVEAERLEKLAKKIGFFVTAASDFHGEKIRADRKLGHTCGRLKIEDRFYTQELKPYLDSLKK